MLVWCNVILPDDSVIIAQMQRCQFVEVEIEVVTVALMQGKSANCGADKVRVGVCLGVHLL